MSKLSMKVKVPKAALKGIEDKVGGMKGAFTEADAKLLGQTIVSEMQKFISKGVSPVEGFGRFPKYSKNYPENVQTRYPNKRKRPVNLNLSGQMLGQLDFRIKDGKFGKVVEVGFYDREANEKVTKNAALGRPAMPGRAQQFISSIQRIIYKTFKEAFARYVNK